MEIEEVKIDPYSQGSEVKIEPREDLNRLDNSLDYNLTMWNFLVKRSRYLYQLESDPEALNEVNRTKLATMLLDEVENLLIEVAGFVRTCCDSQPIISNGDQELEESVVTLKDRVSLGLFGDKNFKLHISPMVQNEVFAQLNLKNEVIPDLDSLPLPSFNSLPSLPSMPAFNESDNESVDNTFEPENPSGATSPDKFSQYPRPKIVPVDYNKKKQVCVCEQCGGSWSRKEYYYHHKSVGKCTPKWIRYSAKNKNRIRCVHPDCEDKKDVNFTYAGIMKHIIELHTSQETSTLQCPDCDLKFPMKAVLKFHQDSVHQAHAMICTICGKIVRDMRKHKLVHSGEKPFQCDRCSYRCSRSGTLKRHMATHLNSGNEPAPPPIKAEENNVLGGNQTVIEHQTTAMETGQAALENPGQQTLQLEQQIPIHIAHHEATDLPEPKFIELSTQQLAQHLPPHSTYTTVPVTVSTIPTVTYRDFKFP